MTNNPLPSTLLSRLREATEGSRELDRAAAEGAGLRVWDEKIFDFHTGQTDRTTPVVGNDSDGWDLLPAYSTSLDAALGLVARFPGYYVSLHDVGGAYWQASIADRPPFEGCAPTAPLALLIALLTALDTPND